MISIFFRVKIWITIFVWETTFPAMKQSSAWRNSSITTLNDTNIYYKVNFIQSLLINWVHFILIDYSDILETPMKNFKTFRALKLVTINFLFDAAKMKAMPTECFTVNSLPLTNWALSLGLLIARRGPFSLFYLLYLWFWVVFLVKSHNFSDNKESPHQQNYHTDHNQCYSLRRNWLLNFIIVWKSIVCLNIRLLVCLNSRFVTRIFILGFFRSVINSFININRSYCRLISSRITNIILY